MLIRLELSKSGMIQNGLNSESAERGAASPCKPLILGWSGNVQLSAATCVSLAHALP